MAKWGGWTEKLWRKQFDWVLATSHYTFGSKCAQCYSWRRSLINSGDWETFPIELKWGIQYFAHIYEKEVFPDYAERDKQTLKNLINKLEEEKQSAMDNLRTLEA